jgi:kynurenine formamidase
MNTPEMPEAVRDGPITWPVHHALLENDVLVIENVCNMRSLVRRRVEVVAAPINVKGGDGAPVRLLARRLEED